MKHISHLLLRLLGWKIDSRAFPFELKKYVIAVAPHTSWKDFFLGLLVRSALNRKIYYLGKKELFENPFGFFFWWTGGRPVDRLHKAGVVDQVTKLFAGSEEFAIAIAPEGTRKRVTDFKTGFYHIARAAGVPVVPCLLDYEHKTVHFKELFYPGPNTEKDLDALWKIFEGVKGARKEYGVSGKRAEEHK